MWAWVGGQVEKVTFSGVDWLDSNMHILIDSQVFLTTWTHNTNRMELTSVRMKNLFQIML